MPYSMSAPPQWSKSKSKAVQKIAVDVFNETFKKAGSESKSRRASLSAMKNAEESFKKSSIIKSVNEELMQVTYVAMKPGVDLHGDEVDLETIRLAKESFNRQLKISKMSNLYHIGETDSFDIIESYLAPCDMELLGNLVTKGEWLVTLSVTDEKLWSMIKADEITGVSIGAMAHAQTVD